MPSTRKPRQNTPSKSPQARKKTPKPARMSRLKKPQDMTLEEWQIALRREFGREQNFRLKNVGNDPFFSEFEVTNPATRRTYRVEIRGEKPGENFCSCPDFAVNTLGTCKHIEFTLARLERKRGGKAAFEKGHQREFSEVCLRYGAQRRVVFRRGENCPPRLRKLVEEYFDENGVLRIGAENAFEKFLKQAGAGSNGLRVREDAIEFIAQMRDREARVQRIEKAFPQGADGPQWKDLLNMSLYPYQREGALYAAKAGRSIIADDMGLGKTIQAIAAAEILAKSLGVEKVLIICPTSLKHQWKQEIQRFTGRSAEVVEGGLTARSHLYDTESFYKITNYDVVFRDRAAIEKWGPDLIILDEAQRIKNWKTRTAKSVKKLESEYALVLTGTPLENRLEELHSIVEFVDLFHLGPLFRFLAEHQHTNEMGRVIGYRNLSQVSETLKPILIRRTKEAVLKQLPERLDKRFFLPMTSQQMNYHEENSEIVAKIVSKWKRYGFLSEKDQRRLLIALQNMRMACNSTYLLDHETDFGVKADELVSTLEDVFEDPDAKVVVFSQWTRTHELLIRRFGTRKWGHVFFHGGVPGPNRKNLIRQFKEDRDCRVFLSTDAGGVGLNLQHASVVVNMDQPWNPAVLEQRIGRVHRLGQHRPVRVLNFISQGTIEEGMLSLLSFKKSLFSGVLDGGENEIFLGGTRLNRFMESVEKATGSIPAPMPVQEDGIAQAEASAGEEETAPSSPQVPHAAQAPVNPEAWADVIATGLTLVEKLSQAVLGTDSPLNLQAMAGSDNGKGEDPAKAAARKITQSFVAVDEETGTPYLRIPMPKPETVQQITALLSGFLKRE